MTPVPGRPAFACARTRLLPARHALVVHSARIALAALGASIVLCAFARTALAADGVLDDLRRAREAGGPTVSLDWDNDAFLPAGSDGFYTNGTRLTMRLPSPTLHEERGEHGERTFHRHVYGLRLGQSIYTPSDIALPPDRLDATDRPYAGHAFLGLFRDTFWSDGAEGRYLRLGLDLGCTGPCSGAEHAQQTVHRWLGAAQPQGWSQQIRNELVVQFRGEYSPGRAVIASWLDFAPYASAALGNAFVNAAAGATLRAGRFNAPFVGSLMSAPTREGLAASQRLDDASARHRTEAFLFARFETRWVGYNATLQGGWFNDSPRTVNAEPFVLETEVGAALVRRRWALAYSVLSRTSEVSGQSTAFGYHRWGRIQLTWQFD